MRFLERFVGKQKLPTLRGIADGREACANMAGTATATSLNVLVNGEAVRLRAANLAELIAELGYGDAKVATALNGEFVPERARAGTRLAPDDRIEIVAPRQGG
jgi:sulfur carrier protein